MKNFIETYTDNGNIIIDNSEETKKYIREAYIYGKDNTNNDFTWTGAVIIDNKGKILSYGANKIKGLDNPKIKLKKGEDGYDDLWHAERNAIFKTGGVFLDNKKGISLEGTTMYMPWVPCTPCANAIIESDISTLVMHKAKVLKTPNHRVDDVKGAVDLLLEKKVKLIFVTDEIGGCESKINGEIWYP